MPSVQSSPGFTPDQAELFTQEIFGIKGTAKALPSERDQNFLLHAEGGERYVLKIANREEDPELLEFQNTVMDHLRQGFPPILCPGVMVSLSGEKISKVFDENGYHYPVRLLTFVPGIPLGQYRPHSPELLRNLGLFTARLVMAFATMPQRKIQPDLIWNLRNGIRVIEELGSYLAHYEHRELLGGFFRQIKEQAHLLTSLPEGLVYNDGNDYNILVAPAEADMASFGAAQISGLIDFGDCTYSFIISDLAIVLAYALLDKNDPLEAAGLIIGAYHEILPLPEVEQKALYPLICLRLCMSVVLCSYQRRLAVENSYLSISEEAIWRLLVKLRSIPPGLFYGLIRQACGLSPVSEEEAIVTWLKENQPAFFPVMGFPLPRESVTIFDLGIGSPLFERKEQWEDMAEVSRILEYQRTQAGAKAGIGRYREARLFYTSPLFKPDGDPFSEGRSLHLGIDIFVPPGSNIYAPLDGRVHSFKDNQSDLDYGPTLILEHNPLPGIRFYTLYGHLNCASLPAFSVGKLFRRGECLGAVGCRKENGGWPPHLHFQIITDMLDRSGDYPGVAFGKQANLWMSLCPNPNLILNIPDEILEDKQLTVEQLLKLRQTHIGKSLSLSYRNPLKIVRGYRQYLYDQQGRMYLDAVNNVPHVGHSHPRVVAAIRQQAAVLNTNTRYLHDNLMLYAQRLLEYLPEPLRVCFFVNSGSEANDLALRLARTYTQSKDYLVLEGAYHGNLSSLVDISPYKFNGPGGSGCPRHTHVLPLPDTYRGLYRDDPDAGLKYAGHLAQVLGDIQENGGRAAAFIAESLPGCGGQIIPPAGYLKEAFRQVREAGALCIADEVQVGFGRCGSHFWAFQAQDAIPDILTLGKPIGNGHPLGAVITTRAIADAFANGMEYFNTYGGNPVSCAAGLAVLEVIREEGLQENALDTGAYLLGRLRDCQERFPLLGDVRGLGLYLGVELVLDAKERTPAARHAAYVAERMCREGVLLSTDGPDRNVLKIKPPLVFTRSDADTLIDKLEGILKETPLAV